MRYLIVPEKVAIEGAENHLTKEPVTWGLDDLITKNFVTDARVIESLENVLKYQQLVKESREKKPGDVWEMESSLHELLSLLVRTFPNYHPNWKLSCLPLFAAVLGAKSEPPKPARSVAVALEADAPG